MITKVEWITFCFLVRCAETWYHYLINSESLRLVTKSMSTTYINLHKTLLAWAWNIHCTIEPWSATLNSVNLKKKMQFPLELTPCFLPFSLLSFVSNFSYKGSSVWTKLIDKLRWLTPIDTNMPTVMKACYIQLNFLNYTFLLISSYETN